MNNYQQRTELVLKRSFEVIVSASTLVLLSPLIILISLAINFDGRAKQFSTPVKSALTHLRSRTRSPFLCFKLDLRKKGAAITFCQPNRELVLKQLFDITVAATALIMLSPVIGLIALGIKRG